MTRRMIVAQLETHPHCLMLIVGRLRWAAAERTRERAEEPAAERARVLPHQLTRLHMRRHDVVELLAGALLAIARIGLPERKPLAVGRVALVLRGIVVAQIVERFDLCILALAQLVVCAQHGKYGALVEIVCSYRLLHILVLRERGA